MYMRTAPRARIEPALEPFVRAIEIDDVSPLRTEPGPYLVLPGPFPVMGFRISGELHSVRGPATTLLARSGVTGLQDGPRRYLPEPGTRSVLVALRPEGAFGLLGIPMHELLNSEVALEGILPAAAVRIAEERVAMAAGAEDARAAIATLLKAAASRSRASAHPALAAAVSDIVAHHGNVRVAQLADRSGITSRHLERLFLSQVGVSPKRLAALARFAWAAARLDRAPSSSQLALSAGYADQAHFIRAFTHLAGTPPKRLLASDVDRRAMSESFNT